MKMSFVITTYNRGSSLERCLSSLAMQEFPRDEYEIVVIADGCSDDTAEVLRRFNSPCSIRCFEQPNQGQPGAQNDGVALATGEYVLFMDDDCICSPGLVAAHYEAHCDGDKRVVIGPVLLHPDVPAGSVRDSVNEVAVSAFQRLSAEGARRSDLMLCANSSISRRLALECPFDVSYERMHDVEAGARLWLRGVRPHFAATAIAYEAYVKTPREMIRDARNHGRYDVKLSAIYPSLKPISGPVRINKGNPITRALRKQLALHSTASEFALRQVSMIADWLYGIPPFSSLATRILKLRCGTAHLAGAIQETGSWDRINDLFGVRIPVLLYHNVGVPRGGEYPGLTTPTVEFEKQVKFLKSLGYQSIRPLDWLRWRDEGGSLPKNPIMLVFDDAYREACYEAFPILERYGFVAACMVVTHAIGQTNRWDEEAGRPSFQLMSKDEIQAWSKKNIEFGGHTCTHPELPLVSEERVEQEVVKCKEELAPLLGHEPASFAYPFGGVSSVAEAWASKGFRLAFTSWPGRLHLGTNPHLAPRISFLPGESRFGMWCRLRLGRNLFEVCRNRWTVLTRMLSRVAGKK